MDCESSLSTEFGVLKPVDLASRRRLRGGYTRHLRNVTFESKIEYAKTGIIISRRNSL